MSITPPPIAFFLFFLPPDRDWETKLMQGPQARDRQSGRKEQKEKDNKIFMMIGDKEYEVEKMAKGGRAGYKKGTGLMKKKSNVEKIKETFCFYFYFYR